MVIGCKFAVQKKSSLYLNEIGPLEFLMRVLTVRSALTDMGPGTQPLTIARELKRQGHHVAFASSGGKFLPEVEKAGFKVHRVPELAHDSHDPLSVLKAIKSLAKVIGKERPDVLHGHNAAATITAFSGGILKGRRIPCVTSVRGVEERDTHQWRNRIWRATPGKLLGVCEKTRERLLSFGVPDKKILVTYNGVDATRFDPRHLNSVATRKMFKLEGKMVVGTVGAITGSDGREGVSKGQHNLVKAVGMLKNKHPNLSILLVGDGPTRHRVEAAVKEAGIEDRVIFAGRRFDVPEMLMGMDIYCLASIYGEFFPNSIIEAMCMGLPWIGSDIAGLSELTADGKAGWVTPIDDVGALAKNLDRLVSDDGLRRKMGKNARQEVMEHFTIEKVAGRILNAYREAGVTAN
ncbi:MAG: hypothetical protein COA47_03065 [Robiginitomaculum sp.]|nr:MAG: hypothetical protein COA47_03065 [Robiginitomaculum sp.]